MPFPFTFNFSVPGLSNPFTNPPLPEPTSTAGPSHSNSQPDADILNIRSNTHDSHYGSLNSNGHLSPNIQTDLGSRGRRTPSQSRKRGWEPSFAEPSQSMTTLASSNGYLDTPAKYRDLAEAQRHGEGGYYEGFQHVEQGTSESTSTSTSASGSTVHIHQVPDRDPAEPPAKRRRGLAGSIVSTALSAALIGTAVGLTVYRLWRDRGKEPQLAIASSSSPPSSPNGSGTGTGAGAPPPPYSPPSDPNPSSSLSNKHQHIMTTLPPTPRRKTHGHTHSVNSSASKRRHHRGRSTYQYGIPSTSSSSSNGANGAVFPPTQPQFDFSFSKPNPQRPPSLRNGVSGHGDEGGAGAGEEDPDIDDQMDWIGNKLSFLIDQGKKALGREVVVMSESREDEDGDREGWVDEGEGEGEDLEWDRRSINSRSGSPRGRRVRRKRGHTPTGSISRRGGGGVGAPPMYSSASAPSSASYTNTSFQPLTPSASSSSFFAPSTPVAINTSNAFGELSSTGGFESPELKESMEKARARVRERMGTSGSFGTR